jgi:hypothetical protein
MMLLGRAPLLNRLVFVVALLLATSSPVVAQQVWFKWASLTSSKDKAQLFLQAFTKQGEPWKRGTAFDTKRECAASLPPFGDKGPLGDGTYAVIGEDPTVIWIETPAEGFFVLKWQCLPASIDPNKHE